MKCKDGYIFFPPEGKCVPRIGSINSPHEKKKIGMVIGGSALLGGFLGWMLRDNEEDQKDAEAYLDKLITDHNLDKFFPQISDFDWYFVEDNSEAINENILKEAELRYAESETEEELQSLIIDLEVLQNYLEQEAVHDGEHDVVAPIIEIIHAIQGSLGGE